MSPIPWATSPDADDDSDDDDDLMLNGDAMQLDQRSQDESAENVEQRRSLEEGQSELMDIETENLPQYLSIEDETKFDETSEVQLESIEQNSNDKLNPEGYDASSSKHEESVSEKDSATVNSTNIARNDESDGEMKNLESITVESRESELTKTPEKSDASIGSKQTNEKEADINNKTDTKLESAEMKEKSSTETVCNFEDSEHGASNIISANEGESSGPSSNDENTKLLIEDKKIQISTPTETLHLENEKNTSDIKSFENSTIEPSSPERNTPNIQNDESKLKRSEIKTDRKIEILEDHESENEVKLDASSSREGRTSSPSEDVEMKDAVFDISKKHEETEEKNAQIESALSEKESMELNDNLDRNGVANSSESTIGVISNINKAKQPSDEKDTEEKRKSPEESVNSSRVSSTQGVEVTGAKGEKRRKLSLEPSNTSFDDDNDDTNL